MKTTGPIEICIEIAPNALGIDMARLTINEEVRERLMLLCCCRRPKTDHLAA
jgi:hypothetical protein